MGPDEEGKRERGKERGKEMDSSGSCLVEPLDECETELDPFLTHNDHRDGTDDLYDGDW